jgi:hypothetical protein
MRSEVPTTSIKCLQEQNQQILYKKLLMRQKHAPTQTTIASKNQSSNIIDHNNLIDQYNNNYRLSLGTFKTPSTLFTKSTLCKD